MVAFNTVRAAVLSVSVLLMVACGGGGGGSSGNSGTPGDSTGSGNPGVDNPDTGEQEFITETGVAIPAGTRLVSALDPGGSSQADLDSATYQIMMFWSAPNGVEFNEILGTGFAVGGDLIATNAHVTSEVLNRARGYLQFGVTLDRVAGFRSETGEEIPLLEAMIHPSYTDIRSPDIGLFVARARLPVALRLATDDEVGQIRRGDPMNLNGFPGDVYDLIFSRGFTPGLSIPRATLFSGNIQSLQKFDERSVIDPLDPLDIDMIQHSMDTSGGTSGSPIMHEGKVVGVHNSGLQVSGFVLGADGTPQVQRLTQATASWGIHVKHLKNLIDEYDSGVLEADKRFRLPVEPQLLQIAPGGGQGAGAAPVAGTISATVSNPANAQVTHQIQMSIDSSGGITGTSSWPANDSGPARQFTLSGQVDASGTFEVTDNTPEINPGFRRGLYNGFINPASGVVRGDYSEFNESSNEIFFFANWTAQLQ